VRAEEHFSEAKRIASDAESKQREPGQQFNPEPWLKAQTHALLALCGQLDEIRSLLTPAEVVATQHFDEPLPGEAE
jgi:hypothetical protein